MPSASMSSRAATGALTSVGPQGAGQAAAPAPAAQGEERDGPLEGGRDGDGAPVNGQAETAEKRHGAVRGRPGPWCGRGESSPDPGTRRPEQPGVLSDVRGPGHVPPLVHAHQEATFAPPDTSWQEGTFVPCISIVPAAKTRDAAVTER